MDWFWNIFDSIIQNRIMHFLFGNLRFFDWITIAMAGIGLYYGLKQGLIRCFAVILETSLVFWVVMSFYKKIGAIFLQNIPALGEANAKPIAYIVLLMLSGVLMLLLDERLKMIFHTKLAGPIKIFGGAVAGVFLLLLMLSMAVQTVIIWPALNLNRSFMDGGSRTGPFVGKLAPNIYKTLSHPTSLFDKKKK